MTTFYFRCTRFIYIILFEHASAMPKRLTALRVLSRSPRTPTSDACSHIIVDCIRLNILCFCCAKNTFSNIKSVVGPLSSRPFRVSWRAAAQNTSLSSFDFYVSGRAAFSLLQLINFARLGSARHMMRHSNAFETSLNAFCVIH